MDIGFGETIDDVPRGSIPSGGLEQARFENPEYEKLLKDSRSEHLEIARASAPYKKQRDTTNFSSDRFSDNGDSQLNTSRRSARSSIAPGMISGHGLTPNTTSVDQKIFQMITDNLFTKLEQFLQE
jgi:hypothetical protein